MMQNPAMPATEKGANKVQESKRSGDHQGQAKLKTVFGNKALKLRIIF